MSERKWRVVAYRLEWLRGKQKERRILLASEFEKRRQARQFCRNRRGIYDRMELVSPDGNVEPFTWCGGN